MPPLISLPAACKAWGSVDFETVFKRELSAAELPLQDYLRYASVALPGSQQVMVLQSWDDAVSIQVKVGVFFAAVVAGCNCADDPTPVPEQTEYAELLVRIDKHSAEVHLDNVG